MALASAGPLVARQDIDFDALKAAPNPTIVTVDADTPKTTAYNLAEATAEAVADPLNLGKRSFEASPVAVPSVEKRFACEPQRAGHGPSVSPDTAEAFLAFDDFKTISEGAPTPNGYVRNFVNLQASNSAYGYMGYTELESYDTALCASKCNAITGCAGMFSLIEYLV
jgi:hypothetical protein